MGRRSLAQAVEGAGLIDEQDRQLQQFISGKPGIASNEEVSRLQAEIEQLRAAQSPDLEQEIAALREQLAQSGEVEVALDLIDPNPTQPRQTITEDNILAKARSLQARGQLAPIILIPQENGRKLIFDGELRWRGATKLGWQTIRAVMTAMPEDLERSALETFLGFQDLNPLDKAEAVVREINKATGLEFAEAATALGTFLKSVERAGSDRMKVLSKLSAEPVEVQRQTLMDLGAVGDTRDLVLVILDLGLNPGTVKTHLFRMLSLPSDLQDAIRSQGLQGAHALKLATLSAEMLNVSEETATEERFAATRQVVEGALTVEQTVELIKAVRKRYAGSAPATAGSKKVETLIKSIKVIPAELKSATQAQITVLREELLSVLKEIDNVEI